MQSKIQEYINKLELKKNENGLIECPFCSFTARSKKMMISHLQGHDKEILKELEKEQKNKEEATPTNKKQGTAFRDPEIKKCNNKKCKVKMVDGTIITGDVVATFKFTIQLNNAKIYEDENTTAVNTLYVQKGNMLYITPLKE